VQTQAHPSATAGVSASPLTLNRDVDAQDTLVAVAKSYSTASDTEIKSMIDQLWTDPEFRKYVQRVEQLLTEHVLLNK
jgi:hypothetical protein